MTSSSLFGRAPRRLSQWKIFDISEKGISLQKKVWSYELSVPLFSDYAGKLRTIQLPDGGEKIHFSPKDTFLMPVGTIVTKSFYYPIEKIASIAVVERNGSLRSYSPLAHPQGVFAGHHLIETRVLYKTARTWRSYSYVWDEDQREAHLNVIGKKFQIVLQGVADTPLNFSYFVPNMNQCIGCHMRMDGFSRTVRPIGLKAKHLNRTIVVATGEVNQLEHWTNKQWLEGTKEIERLPRLSSINDPHASPEQKARSYLDINCAHCHSPSGPANTSGLFLTYETRDPHRYGVCKTPVAAGNGGNEGRYDIEPGNPEGSLLLQRLKSTDPAVRMPEFGRSLSHGPAVNLISRWISGIGGDCD